MLFAGIAVARCSCCGAASRCAAAVPRAGAIRSRPPIFTLASALIVANALWTDLFRPMIYGDAWGPAAAGLVVIAAGLPVYFAAAVARPASA